MVSSLWETILKHVVDIDLTKGIKRDNPLSFSGQDPSPVCSQGKGIFFPTWLNCSEKNDYSPTSLPSSENPLRNTFEFRSKPPCVCTMQTQMAFSKTSTGTNNSTNWDDHVAFSSLIVWKTVIVNYSYSLITILAVPWTCFIKTSTS